MQEYTSALISINCRERGSYGINIDRTFPTILDQKMSTSDWESFCDGVDKVLRPGALEENIFPSLIMIVILLAFFLLWTAFLLIPVSIFAIFFVIKYICRHLILMCGKVNKKMISLVRMKVKQNLKNYLDTESAKHRAKNISFLFLGGVEDFGQIIECRIYRGGTNEEEVNLRSDTNYNTNEGEVDLQFSVTHTTSNITRTVENNANRSNEEEEVAFVGLLT